MPSDLIHRLQRGFGANLYGQGVVVLIQIAGVPILLHCWGAPLYGEWLILFAIPAYLTMTDLGFSQSAGNDMTARAARGDDAGMLSVFQSLAALVYSSAALGMLLVGLLIAALPLHDWFGFERLSVDDVRWILWLLAAGVLIKLADGVSHAGYRANGDYAFHTSIYYSTLLFEQSVIWAMAAAGYGPVGAAFGFLLVRVIVTPAVAVLLVYRHPRLRFGFAQARLAILATLARPALANLAMPLAQAINIQGMVLVVGGILGPAAVVVFATQRTLTRLALQMVLSVHHALEPELARAWGMAETDLVRRLYGRGFALAFWLALGAVLALLLLGPWILDFWTGGQVQMDRALFGWLLASAFATVLWYGGLTLLKSANRHLRAAVWFVLSALASLLLALLLLRVTGRLAAAGVALFVMDLLMMAYLLTATGRLLALPVSRLLGAAINLSSLFKTLSGIAAQGIRR